MIELYQEDPLYLAIMHNDLPQIKKLKDNGTVISEHIRTILTSAVGGAAKASGYTLTFYGHIDAVGTMNVKKLIHVLYRLKEEVGRPMYCSSAYGWEYQKRFYDEPGLFICVIDCFDNKKMPKSLIWDEIIIRDNAELLAFTVEKGWLKTAKKREELIRFATDKNKTECLAWLLDYKKRTADIVEEQAKAERKLQRELNANPDSVTELKKRWGFQKQEDGTLIITSCKKGLGSSTVITVPEKIGKDTVTAIGDYAFAAYASRVTDTMRDFRQSITEIILPPTVKSIGKYAFDRCESLEKINIPEGVKSIGEAAFSSCKNLKEISLPNSICEIGHWAFSHCRFEKIVVPDKVEDVSAFNNCNNLKEAILPKNLKEIGRYSFNRCIALKEIEIPKGTEILEAYSFSFCEGLEKIILQSGIKKIGRYAFEYCKSLKEITIPEGVEEIDACAFVKCFSLEKIYLPKSLKKIKNVSNKQSTVHFLYDSSKAAAIVHKGSYAEKYCKRNNIPCELAEE